MHQQPGAATAGEKTSAHSEVAHPPHSRIHSRSLSTLGHESAARSLTHSLSAPLESSASARCRKSEIRHHRRGLQPRHIIEDNNARTLPLSVYLMMTNLAVTCDFQLSVR
jgi:hypothetical protein